jgi:hypothetical protein
MPMNRKVSIWKHVRLADGKWRYCRPVLDEKGKIVPHMSEAAARKEKENQLLTERLQESVVPLFIVSVWATHLFDEKRVW